MGKDRSTVGRALAMAMAVVMPCVMVISALAQPAAAPPKPAPAKPKPGASTVTSKGFARVDVTPAYKDEFQAETRIAVLVAPSYRNSGLNVLRYNYIDALDLKGELERQGYKVRMINPSEATADNVRQALRDSKQLLDGADQGTFLFAFSGHGFQSAKGNFLVTVGATRETVEQEALPLAEVEALLNQSGARRKVLLVDACRNDPEAKSSDGPRSFNEFREAEGTSILLSTRPGGFSYEDSDLGHGIFTYYVLEGLRGKAAGKDGYVTFSDLQRYVENNVVNQALKKDRVQRPFMMGERSGDFLLATGGKPAPEEIPAAPAGAQIVDSNTLVLREVGKEPAKSYFAVMGDGKLTLVGATTLAPYAVLAELPKNDLASPYRHFKGNFGDNGVIEAGVAFQGDDVVSVGARIGTPCAGNNACINPNQLVVIPGEKAPNGGQAVSTAKNTTGALAGRLGGFLGNKTQRANDATNVGTTGLDAAMNGNKELLKFTWTRFELTSNVPGKK